MTGADDRVARISEIFGLLDDVPPGDHDQRISLCREALALMTPDEAASAAAGWLQFVTGKALVNRAGPDRVADLTAAIGAFQAALATWTPEDQPANWAAVHVNLGVAYSDRHVLTGSREDEEGALGALNIALQVIDPRRDPVQWARLANNLGTTLLERTGGDRAGDLEEAIGYLEAAARLQEQVASRAEWARTQANLGVAYRERVNGERPANLERSLACLGTALDSLGDDHDPADRARILLQRAETLRYRVAGTWSANVELAYADARLATELTATARGTLAWAEAQAELGDVLRLRTAGSRAENLEEAIACYRRALACFDPATSPQRWALVSTDLGGALAERIHGEQATNLEEAVAHLAGAAAALRDVSGAAAQYAAVLATLGSMYLRRRGGVSATNAEVAWRYLSEARDLEERLGVPPQARAAVLYLLGSAAMAREEGGDREQHVEDAIACYELGLELAGPENGQLQARLLSGLAAAYAQRSRGDQAGNIARSRQLHERLSVLVTHEMSPLELAEARGNAAPVLGGSVVLRKQLVSAGSGWMLPPERTPVFEEAFTAGETAPGEPPENEAPTYRGRDGGEPTARGAESPRPRYLVAQLPERAPTGRRVSLLVSIQLKALAADQFSSRTKPIDVPPQGRDVVISVSAPGLTTLGDLEQDLHVPQAADSEPVRFGFVAGRAGLHQVTVQAFTGGTFLAELALQISVEVGAALDEGPPRVAEVGALASEPGEVTLQVSVTEDKRLSFQLFGEALYPVELSKRLAGEPGPAVDALVAELCSYATGTSAYTSSALVRTRLRNLGARLWADAVPEAVRRQFWEQADKIKLFTVASEQDTVPWELLYPVDGDNEIGFLVERFPVVRRVYGQGRARTLPLASAAYVVPIGSPENAMDEVRAVRGRLGGRVADHGVLDHLDQLTSLLASAPSVLHFACHNQFDAGGSVVNLADGPFQPDDLSIAVQRRALAAASPLVFFNACRTAGEIPGLVQMMGWAKQFMGAGAGAFIGSLWAVRSSSARVFADAFYEAFVTRRVPLGAASLQARKAIAEDSGDPTWLAYTVYGNPAATIEAGDGA